MARVIVDPSQADVMTAEADIVHHPGMWSRGTVEYAQLGGHAGQRISIIVVVRQDLGLPGTNDVDRSETRVMEVRLAKNGSGEWEFDQLASAGGHPVARPDDLSPLASWVVDNKRISLPDTAKWDIYRGDIDPALLRLMADIAGETPYKVVVLITGHSYYVFGTDRVSNHSVGRAVDIYAIEDQRVIDSHHLSSDMYALSETLVNRTDVREFGSPWLFDGAVARNFTNEVHHDHLHIGVYPASLPPG